MTELSTPSTPNAWEQGEASAGVWECSPGPSRKVYVIF
jgi:hypothetical protein